MKNQPVLTIAIPIYNGERTIKNMLDILMPQCNEKIEVLVSDNCSTDSTPNIIKEYQNKWGNISYWCNETNLKTDRNCIKCLQKAKGKYTWLMSDDDIIMENAVDKILKFIENGDDMGLIYVTTRDFRNKYIDSESCQKHEPEAMNDIYTKDKKLFMKYAGYYWGFLASFICNTDNFKKIENPEQYADTYWLQSYIHALCAKGEDTKLGIVKGPCVGAGIYVNTPNFDSALINGVYYKKMIDFMINEIGFDKKQLNQMYKNRTCHLFIHDILKEKASGIHKMNYKTMYLCTRKYVKAWVMVYPCMFVPSFICSKLMKKYRKRLRIKDDIRINRPE